jgi:hypothetical protein
MPLILLEEEECEFLFSEASKKEALAHFIPGRVRKSLHLKGWYTRLRTVPISRKVRTSED